MGHLERQEILRQRFSDFATFHERITTDILSVDPTAIANWANEQTVKKETNFTSLLTSPFKEAASQGFRKYIQNEREMQQFWEKHNLSTPTDKVKQELLKIVQKDTTETSHKEDVWLRRMHGGIALVVSPERFAEIVQPKLHTPEGKLLTGKDAAEELEAFAQVGFTFEQEELHISSDFPFPKSAKIAVIQNTPGFENAIAHEERELIGFYMDEVTKSDRNDNRHVETIRRLRRRFGATEKVGEAMYDLATRIENGERNPAVQLFKTDEDNQQVFSLIAYQAKEIIQDSKHTASQIRGAVLNPKKLLEYWNLDNQSNSEESNVRENTNTITLTSERKGRFVYNKATLRPGDTIIHDRITYQVTEILSATGGQGVVYKAQEIGKPETKIVVKEVIFNAPEALIANEATASMVVEGIAKNNPDMSQLLKNLQLFAGNEEFGIEYINFIKTKLSDDTFWNQFGGKNLYKKENLSFRTHDSQTGQPFIAPPYREIIDAVKQAAAEYTKTYIAEEKRKELNEVVQFFLSEANAMARLSGVKGVAHMIGMVASDMSFAPDNLKYHCMYIIEEFIEGSTLQNLWQIGSGKRGDFIKASELVSEILATLSEVHANEVVHKDIKPENVIIEAKSGEPKLIDFGIAKTHLKDLISAQKQGTRTGTSLRGTLGYVSPEHYTGTDTRSDIYSMGMMMYAMLTGDDPGDYIARTLQFKQIASYVDIRIALLETIDKRFPKHLREIVVKAVQEDPDKRFQSADEMKTAIDEIIDKIKKPLKQIQQPVQTIQSVTSSQSIIPLPVFNKDNKRTTWFSGLEFSAINAIRLNRPDIVQKALDSLKTYISPSDTIITKKSVETIAHITHSLHNEGEQMGQSLKSYSLDLLETGIFAEKDTFIIPPQYHAHLQKFTKEWIINSGFTDVPLSKTQEWDMASDKRTYEDLPVEIRIYFETTEIIIEHMKTTKDMTRKTELQDRLKKFQWQAPYWSDPGFQYLTFRKAEELRNRLK